MGRDNALQRILTHTYTPHLLQLLTYIIVIITISIIIIIIIIIII